MREREKSAEKREDIITLAIIASTQFMEHLHLALETKCMRLVTLSLRLDILLYLPENIANAIVLMISN